ncbi:MAG: CDP-diacylglycerol--glycerol-3-phosphate 3-phosphatidyltransferase [candidate division Zixibacteria bacterium CG_4_9_14_3_um_filter_46_8]|nr:MAG: CDP-diacylglycerol--glycerol-3-phosphate 3-phosphatidyltransferase [candidate division Zixibacteria bacterium CG_4_9_14_3_um_filter_46_8]
MNLPNKLTISRIILSPVFMFLLTIENRIARVLSLVVFTVASLTDLYDGYLARKYSIATNFGKFMDPLADKILTSMAFISFVALGYARAWMVMIIVGRELFITGLRSLAAYRGQVIMPSFLAQAKTASQMVVIVFMLIVINGQAILGSLADNIVLFDTSKMQSYFDVMIFITLLLTVWTGLDYIIRSFAMLKSLTK